MSAKINVIAAVGLALGGALGMAGAMVLQQNVQAILWAIDGAGLVMATPLLAIKYFRMGNDIVAGGFLVFAIGEGVILLSGPAAGLAGSIPAFAAGTALWGTALLLVSIPKLFAAPVRLLGIVSAVLFMITSARIFWGEQLVPDIDAAADLCLSLPCGDLRWLDLDALAGARLTLSLGCSDGLVTVTMHSSLRGRLACLVRANQCPAPFAKIFPFPPDPNHFTILRHPGPHRGAFRDRHERWAWDAMDAGGAADESAYLADGEVVWS